MSDVVVLKVGSKENTYTRAIQGKWLSDKLALSKVHEKEIKTPLYAFNAGITHRSSKGLDFSRPLCMGQEPGFCDSRQGVQGNRI